MGITTQKRYTLWLKADQVDGVPVGKDIEMAQAIGSPFWTKIWKLAKETCGEENIYYTFG
jgi:hypothetical protein